jgi:hypothetical protein
MNIYAIDKDSDKLLLVSTRMTGGIDKELYVVNGGYQLERNKDGSVSPFGASWKAYFVMQAPVTGHYNAILEEAGKILNNPGSFDMMKGG